MPLNTTKYALPYPIPSDTPDVPRDIKALAEAVEAAFGLAMPTGSVLPYAGSTAPSGWALCNGAAHGSAALQAVIGSANTPNLGGKFLVGVGTGYALGSTGGLASVTLSATEAGAGAHSHSISVNIPVNSHTHDVAAYTVLSRIETADHAHVADPPATGTYGGGGHNHGVIVREGSGTDADGPYLDSNPNNQNASRNVGWTDGGGHEHAVDIPGFWTSGVGTNHQHYVDLPTRTTTGPSTNPTATATAGASSPAAASSAHENRPPYFSINFIIKL